MFNRNTILAAGAWSSLAALLVALPAEAGQHGHARVVQGSSGAGYVQSRQVSRQPGAVSVQQNVQTHGGYGAAHSRNAAWADGLYQGGASHTFNNGASASRSPPSRTMATARSATPAPAPASRVKPRPRPAPSSARRNRSFAPRSFHDYHRSCS